MIPKIILKNKGIKNKKGQIGEAVQDLVGLIIIALLLIIFFIFSKAIWGGSVGLVRENAVEQLFQNQEIISLEAWLQQSVIITYEGKEQSITMPELIRLSRINPLYKSSLDTEVQKAFGEDYEFKILSQSEMVQIGWKPELIGQSLIFTPYVKEIGSFVYLPSDETGEAIVVTLKKK